MATADLRSSGLVVELNENNAYTVTFTFPDAYSMSGAWTAWLGCNPSDAPAAALTITPVVGAHTVTLTITAVQTLAVASSLVNLYLAQAGQVLIRAKVRSSDTTGAPTTAGVTVAVNSAVSVTVDIANGITVTLASLNDYPATTDARYAPLRGAGVARFVAKMLQGNAVAVTFAGDSVMAGYYATTMGTDDAASLLCTTLATRFGVTVTKNNRAASGRTIGQWMHGFFATALADNADLYVIGATRNGVGSDSPVINPALTPGAGYPMAASVAGVEHIIRRIRRDRPDADILITSENPYTAGQPSNTALIAYNKQLARLAALYGCEWVDGYAAFTALGDYSSYLFDGVHPNSAGHALLAATMLASFAVVAVRQATPPPLPEQARLGAERYDRLEWTHLTVASGTALTDRFGPQGTAGWTGAGPYVCSTAGSYMLFMGKFSELELELTLGAGAGVVHIDVDGVRTYANLDLSTLPAGRTIPIIGLLPGVHTVLLTVVSGTLTIAGCWMLHAPVTWLDANSTLVTQGGGYTVETLGGHYGLNALVVPGSGTLAFEFVGTALVMEWQRLSGGYILTPTIDGVTSAAVTIGVTGTLGTSPAYGSVTIVSGLEYGRHTFSGVIAGGSAHRISGFSIYDETRLARPRRQSGVCVVGSAMTYAVPFVGRPLVRCNNVTTDTGIVRPTVESASGFTPSGTAAEKATYDAEGGLVAY